MASLDSLPADQRAVLELVLRRGRNYDQIAQLLGIDRAAVRERALAALDALGPSTGVSAERRAVITDYLLGQLPDDAAEDIRDRLAASASERAWARVLASELAPMAAGPLPEIPVDGGRRQRSRPTEDPGAAEEPAPPREPIAAAPGGPAEAAAAPTETEQPVARRERPGRGRSSLRPRPISRRGGAVLLALIGAAVIAVVVVLLVGGGSSKKHTSTAAQTSSTATSSTSPQVLARIQLVPATAGSKAAGVAEVVRQGTTTAIAIAAANLAANTKRPPNAYAVWLANSGADSRLLGFVNPGVGSNGRLQTGGVLPANAGHYKQVLLTLETKANPRTPGQIVLEGALSGL